MKKFYELNFVALVTCFFSLCSVGCSQPDKGTLISISTEAHGNVVFGVASPNGESETIESPGGMIMAIPTGQQRRKDVVRDIDSIWSEIATEWNLTVICPASSTGIPFFSEDLGWFGQGAEVIIPALLRDLRNRFDWNGQNLTLIEIGGNGGGSLSIVSQSPAAFSRVYIVPSFDVELGYFESFFLQTEHNLDIFVVYGTQHRTRFEDWLSTQELMEHTTKVLRAPLDPLYRQGQKDDVDLFVDYAKFVCDHLSLIAR